MDRTATILSSALGRWDPTARIIQTETITPDASLRRYYRLSLESQTDAPATIVAMVFDSVAAAEAGGGPAVSSDEAYSQLSRYFLSHGWPVPELYFEARDLNVFFIEDLGSTQLCASLVGPGADRYSEAAKDELYKGAVELIASLQRLPRQKSFFPFERGFNEALYRKEIDEFREFVFLPAAPGSAAVALLQRLFDELVAALCSRPRVLVHRDFHSWNLLIDRTGDLRVIDFQDACLGTRAYDLVALLNDRDTDELLGRRRYNMLLEHFIEAADTDEDFLEEYLLTLLQRDLKVAGRFSKLAVVRGLDAYRQWVPGTMRRLGRTLEALAERGVLKGAGELLAALDNLFSTVRGRNGLSGA